LTLFGTPIRLDFRSGQPIYVQIVEQIRAWVAEGALKPGDQLPTVRQLATELRVNFNTVARAYRILDEAGLISTQQGRGTYIWEAPSEETLQRIRQQSLQALARHFINQAARLGASPDEVLAEASRQINQWQVEGSAPDPDREI
jgi:GntR family transcriptional regulator